MKRTPPLNVTSMVPAVAVALVLALALMPSPASAASGAPAKIVRVDYVLALMDAGIDQNEIIRRIVEKNLAFDLEPDDLDRLREAGCGDNLIEVMTAEQNPGPSEGSSDGGYARGYTSLSFSYGYPYYYDPYYYPYYYGHPSYGYNVFYSSPYYHYPRHSFRSAPRGGGWGRVGPRGGAGIAPHGGGRPRSAPRGSHH